MNPFMVSMAPPYWPSFLLKVLFSMIKRPRMVLSTRIAPPALSALFCTNVQLLTSKRETSSTRTAAPFSPRFPRKRLWRSSTRTRSSDIETALPVNRPPFPLKSESTTLRMGVSTEEGSLLTSPLCTLSTFVCQSSSLTGVLLSEKEVSRIQTVP